MIKYYDKYHLIGIATITAIIVILVSIWIPNFYVSDRLGGTGVVLLLTAFAMFMHKVIDEAFS